MVDRVWDEARRHLEEDVGASKAARIQLFLQCPGGFGKRLEFFRRPKVGASFKETDVNTIELERRNQIENLVMRKEREREVCTGKFELHHGSMNRVFPGCSHSA